MNPSHIEILQSLDLVPKPDEPPKRKPGRPKGSKNKKSTKTAEGSTSNGKRKRGRPKGSKNKLKQQDIPVGTD